MYTRWIVKRPDGLLFVFDGRLGGKRRGPFEKLEEAVEAMKVEETETTLSITAEVVPDAPVKAPRKRRTKVEIAAANYGEAPSTEIVPAVKKETQDDKIARRTAEAEARAKEALEVAGEYEISDQESMDFVVEWLEQTVEERKSLEAERDSYTKPLLEIKNKIYNKFKVGIGFLTALENLQKGKIGAFRLERQKQQDAALAAVAASGGVADESTLVIAHGAAVVALPSGVREKIRWKWAAPDLSLVPEHYKKVVLDEDKINLEVSVKGADARIPGIVVEREVDIHRTGR